MDQDHESRGNLIRVTPQSTDAAASTWTDSKEGAGDHVAVLGRLFVLPEARGHALGEKLMRAALDHAQHEGLRLVLDVMTKDEAATRLYERLGWQRTGTTEHDNGRGQRVPAYCYVSPSGF